MSREETEAGRRAAMKGSEGRNCGLWMLCRGVLAAACLATVLGAVAAAPTTKTTAIAIDGNPQDWASYPVLIRDAVGDNQGGGFDVSDVRAFTNDAYLYLLIETDGARKDYVQVPIDVQAGARHLRLIIRPEEGGPAELAEISTEGEFADLGSVRGSVCYAATAVELKVPLAALDGVQDLTLLDVHPMAGEPGEPSWHAVDHAGPAEIPHLNEVESVVTRVCDVSVSPPSPAGSFRPAPVQFTQSGFRAEWFVPPGAFNMPLEVMLTPSGDILVLAVRAGKLFRVTVDGRVATLATGVPGYVGAVDVEGNIYLYHHPSGCITKVLPTGSTTVVVQSQELRANCDSAFGIGPDGNLYLALSRCSDLATLLRITPRGAISVAKTDVPQLHALRCSSDGRFLAASDDEVLQFRFSDFSYASLGRVPGDLGISPGGLAIDPDGNIYVSTGARDSHGAVWRLDQHGQWTQIAAVPQNGLSGIEWLTASREIIGGQLRQGGLVAVSLDGTLRTIVAGNGLVSPMAMAFSPCGELAVSCDDGGMMSLVDRTGTASWFFDYISFTPPESFVAFAPDGTLFTSEAAPDLRPVRVAMMSPGQALETFRAADMPSGLALRPDGSLIVSETGAGRITEFNGDGSSTTLAEGLQYPQGLALDASGNLYAVTGTGGDLPPEGWLPSQGDTVLRIAPEGGVTTVARVGYTCALAISPSGELFATTRDGVATISSSGKVKSLLSGLLDPMGLAFDFAGNLYVSDEALNGIVRISGFPCGTLSGVVVNETGALVPGAQIRAVSERPMVVGAVVTSSSEGHFSFQAAPCTCDLHITMQGYANATLEGIHITANKETSVRVVIKQS